MDSGFLLLAVTAASIGFLHTVTGPDHYLPFIVISRARRWSRRRTALVTALCGVGHVMGSVVLGGLGIGLGLALNKVKLVEGVRGNLAAWLLISFGLVYTVWGLRQAWRNRTHSHPHVHADGTVHTHDHGHGHPHAHLHPHPHAGDRSLRSLTPWALFIIFVLGPCEPLIPILMYPAARNSVAGLVGVTAVFGTVTIATMVGMVLLADQGVRRLSLGRLERYTHALAGLAILGSGLAIQFLGL